MYILLQQLVVSLKILTPLFILKYPFSASWANYFLDIVDGDILQAIGMNDITYQLIDKSADLFSYIIMALASINWQIRKTILVLFIYRLIGQLLFFTTGQEQYFFYFQNFLEPLFLIYSLFIFKFKSEKKAYLFYKKHILLVWFIILAYKIWNEWYLHLANIDLSTIFFNFNGGGI